MYAIRSYYGEYRIISGLAETSVPVPPALGLCDDEGGFPGGSETKGVYDGVVGITQVVV